MIRLRLVRDIRTEMSTSGRLFHGDDLLCYTLENPWRDNKRRVSCIPTGTYDIRFRLVGGWQERARETFPDLHNPLRGMLELQDVPGRDYILIHWGNFPRHTQGCILVGEARGPDKVEQSRDAYTALYPAIAEALGCGQRVQITIEDAT